MKQIKKIFAIIFSGLFLFFNFAHAQLVNCGRAGQEACEILDLVFLVERIINFMLTWAWLISIVFILWGAWGMMTSGGNEEAVTKGKETLKHAIIGFCLIMAAYLLVNLAVSILTGQGDPRAGSFDLIKSLLYR